MSPVEKSGLYYPNKFGLITIQSLEEVMGKNGLNAILNLAGLNHYIDNYPADNLDKGFDFSELSSLGVALEEMYGPRGGRGLALRAGRATFAEAFEEFWRIGWCCRSWLLWFCRCNQNFALACLPLPKSSHNSQINIQLSKKKTTNLFGQSTNVPVVGGAQVRISQYVLSQQAYCRKR